jgi:hypothetical protein
MRMRFHLLLAVALFLVTSPALAERTDELVLYNGNTITGEVKSLQQGKLKFKTDHADTIYVKWEYVHSLTSSDFFEVENQIGEYFYGMLNAGTEERQLSVIGPTRTVVLDMERVVAILPIKQTFWGRVDGSLNLGFSYTSADSILQYSLESDASYRMRKYTASIILNSIQTRQEIREDDIVRDSLEFRYTRHHTKRYFGSGSLTFSRNSELGIDFRSQLSYSFGRSFIKTNRTRLSGNLGLAVSREKPIGEEPNDHYLSGIIGGSYHFFLYNYPKTDIFIDLTLMPGITDWPRARAEFNASLRREVMKDFTVNFSAYDSYDSDPPVSSDSDSPLGSTIHHDYGVILSVGWTF